MADDENQQDDNELELDLEPEQETAEQPPDEGQEPEPQPPEEPEEQPLAAQEQPETTVPPVRQPSRSESRIRTLTEQVRDRDQRMADLNRRLDELTRQVQQPRAPVEAPEQRAQRLALMTPEERMQETLREATTSFNQQLQTMQVQQLESSDRTAFQMKAANDPLYAKYAPKVEAKLAEIRTKGGNAEREVLLKFLIGEAALERRGSKEGKREVRQAQQRVKRATTRPPNSGSDTAAQRRRGEESLERRLENVQI